MAIFSNQATLSFGDTSIDSNVAFGEILEVLTATKTAIENSYTTDSTVTYVVTLRNSGSAAINGLTVTDNLGAYTFGTDTVYPLSYVADSVNVFVDGVPQSTPTVSAGPPLVITGITVPAEGSTVIVYQTETTEFANPNPDATIDNTVTVTGDGFSTPVTATATVVSEESPRLTITKSISPNRVVDNDRVTYTFVIENFGNTAIVATDDAVVTDTFDPVLTDIIVTLNGTVLTEGVQYNYNETTGVFSTVAGQITVPAATFVRDTVTGEFSAIPGSTTLIVNGTI